MSKNNLQSEPVVQPEQPVVEPVQPVPPVLKPNVVELNPLHIVQPIELFQTIKANAKQWEEPVVEPEPEVEETTPVPNVKLIKRQGRWFVIGILLVIVMAILFVTGFKIPGIIDFESTKANLVASVGSSLHNGSYAVIIVSYALVVIALSIAIRFFACAKKKPTCAGCEFVKFCWTATLTTIVGFVVLALTGVEWFATTGSRLLDLFTNPKSVPQVSATLAYVLLAFCLVLFVFVIVLTIAHKASHKKNK